MEPVQQQQLAEPARRGRTVRQADQLPPKPCPRCDSTNTKFCYYNNYSSSQPRYFCRACRRYWTQGGTLRNVPLGGGGGRRGRRSRRSTAASTSAGATGIISSAGSPIHPDHQIRLEEAEVVEPSITAPAAHGDALPPLPYSYYSSGGVMDGLMGSAAAGSGSMMGGLSGNGFQAAAAAPVAVTPLSPLFEPHQCVYQFNLPAVQFLRPAATPQQGWQHHQLAPQQQTVFTTTTTASRSNGPNTAAVAAAAGGEAVDGGADGYWRELIPGDGSGNWAAAADLSYRGHRTPFI